MKVQDLRTGISTGGGLVMTGSRWAVVLKTKPIDPGTAEQEARWLRLGDDALSNHPAQELEPRQIAPGLRALRRLERVTHESQQALEKYREEKRRFL